jgi:hypothetical protein
VVGDRGGLPRAGLLANCVTTLDVLSHGRAWLGIGVARKIQRAPRALRFGRPRLRGDRKDDPFPLRPRPSGEHVDAILGELKRFAELGIVHAQGVVAGATSNRPLKLTGERIIPVAAGL